VQVPPRYQIPLALIVLLGHWASLAKECSFFFFLVKQILLPPSCRRCRSSMALFGTHRQPKPSILLPLEILRPRFFFSSGAGSVPFLLQRRWRNGSYSFVPLRKHPHLSRIHPFPPIHLYTDESLLPPTCKAQSLRSWFMRDEVLPPSDLTLSPPPNFPSFVT